MPKHIDLTGQKFGQLTVIKQYDIKNGIKRYLCKCDCGNEAIIYGNHLKSGNTKSCGCLRHTHNLKHGQTHTRLYNIWQGIKRRCYNENDRKYKDYGGRGIKVYDDWLNDFTPFYEWAITNGYKDNLTLDRIDVDGDYSPANCRWADDLIQAHNKRLDKLYTYNGKTLSVRDWCKEIGFYWSLFA